MERKGYFGEFGGADVDPKTLAVLNELETAFDEFKDDKSFSEQYINLLKDYVGRPSPLYYATNLSRKYGTNIYLKREDLNHTGSHKINNVLGQVLLAKYMGKKKVIAETGAGQHGLASATACTLLGLECKVFMGVTDIARQKPNVEKMKLLGADVVGIAAGSGTLSDAVDAALDYWVENSEDSFYLLGSAVGPHPYPTIVGYFQSIISREIACQLEEKCGKRNPDYVIAAVGGGSNATGAFMEFVEQKEVRLIGAEAGGISLVIGENAATLELGRPSTIHGYKTIVLLDKSNNIAQTKSISAGLDYPGVSPFLAHLSTEGRMSSVAILDDEAMAAAKLLMKIEGIIPAIESAHALAVLGKMNFLADDIVVVNLSGRGDKDIDAYLESK